MPLVLAAEGLDRIVLKYLHLPQTERRMEAWEDLVSRIKNPLDELTIHVVGKYVGYEDSYKSLNEALYHGGFAHRLKVNIKWIEAEALEEPNGAALLDGADGILVPGGFGDRGTRGMMKAAQMAREREHPVLRHLLRLPDGDRGVRAQRRRAAGGRLDRVRTRHADQGDLQAARSSRASTTSAARCGSAPMPASSRRARWRSASTARTRSASAIVTASSSIVSTNDS